MKVVQFVGVRVHVIVYWKEVRGLIHFSSLKQACDYQWEMGGSNGWCTVL